MKDVQCKIFYLLGPLFISVIKTQLLRTYMLNVSVFACKMKKKGKETVLHFRSLPNPYCYSLVQVGRSSQIIVGAF